MKIDKIKKTRLRRRYRVRRKIFGTAERPRLSIYRSNRHIYAQIIDDLAGVTLASANTRTAIAADLKNCGNKEAATKVGVAIAKEAGKVGIKCVTFDRNRFKFHGRVKSLADAAREGGLVF